jgi:hypothetical protein
MKKLITLLLALSLILSLELPVAATETTVETEETAAAQTVNRCGADMTWEYADGVLTITGSGDMDDFSDAAPWAEYKKEIKRVVLSGSITYIGAHAFTNYDALTTVNFGSALYEIGKEAFKSCDGLTVIYLPASFKVFGESSFSSCSGLTAIHCSGRFPSFRQNCLWDTYGTIYYPAEKPWNVENIADLEAAFKGRIEFLASDGTDHYNPDGETEAVTEAPTEVPTEAPTAAPTEPPTEAPTEMPTEAPVEVTTAPAAPVETEAPEQETIPAEKPEPESKSWIGLVIIGAVALFLLVGIIAVRVGSNRGKYSKRRRKR